MPGISPIYGGEPASFTTPRSRMAAKSATGRMEVAAGQRDNFSDSVA